MSTSSLPHTKKLPSSQLLPAVLEGELPHLCGAIQAEQLHLTHSLSRCTDQSGGNKNPAYFWSAFVPLPAVAFFLPINSSRLPELCHVGLLPSLKFLSRFDPGCLAVLNLCPTCNVAPPELWMLTLQTPAPCLCCTLQSGLPVECLCSKQGNFFSHTADHHVLSNHISWQGQAEINQTAELIRLVRKHSNETIRLIWQQHKHLGHRL